MNTLRFKAFTLAELLIALAILGVIATFTIPKILQAQQDGRYKAMGKEAAATISQAYQLYKLNNTPTSSFAPAMLTQYMNYVSVETAGTIDHVQTFTTATCSGGSPCLHFHNGAALLPIGGITFGGMTPSNAVLYLFDPDGKVTDGTTNGPGKAVQFFLYYSGRIQSNGTLNPSAVSSDSTRSAMPSFDPPWFGWN